MMNRNGRLGIIFILLLGLVFIPAISVNHDLNVSAEKPSLWEGMNGEPFYGADKECSKNISFISQWDNDINGIFHNDSFQVKFDNEGNPHIAWAASIGNLFSGLKSDNMYIKWSGSEWVTTDGAPFSLTPETFHESKANISKTGSSWLYSFQLDSLGNPHFIWIQNFDDLQGIVYIFWDGEKWSAANGEEYEPNSSSSVIVKIPKNSGNLLLDPKLVLDSKNNPVIFWKYSEVSENSYLDSLCYLKWNSEDWVTLNGEPIVSNDVSPAKLYVPIFMISTYEVNIDEKCHPTILLNWRERQLEYIGFDGSSWKNINGSIIETEKIDSIEKEGHLYPSTILSFENNYAISLQLDEEITPHISLARKKVLDDYSEKDLLELYYLKYTGGEWVNEKNESFSKKGINFVTNPIQAVSALNISGMNIFSILKFDNSENPQIAYMISDRFKKKHEVFYVRFDGKKWVSASGKLLDKNLSLENPCRVSTVSNDSKNHLLNAFEIGNDGIPCMITEMLHNFPDDELSEDGWNENPVYFFKGNPEVFGMYECAQKTVELYIDSEDFLVDGEMDYFEVPPKIINDRTFVPLRALGDVLGCETEWVSSERKVIYTRTNPCDGEKTKLELWIGKNVGMKNSETWDMGIAPVIVDDRTLVPLRVISEGLGADVLWNAAERKVTITIQ